MYMHQNASTYAPAPFHPHTLTQTAFLNELFEALNLNTVGGDAVIGAEVDTDFLSALVEFRTVKEASLAKETLVGVVLRVLGFGASELT